MRISQLYSCYEYCNVCKKIAQTLMQFDSVLCWLASWFRLPLPAASCNANCMLLYGIFSLQFHKLIFYLSIFKVHNSICNIVTELRSCVASWKSAMMQGSNTNKFYLYINLWNFKCKPYPTRCTTQGELKERGVGECSRSVEKFEILAASRGKV